VDDLKTGTQISLIYSYEACDHMLTAEIGNEYIFGVPEKYKRTKFLQSDALTTKILQSQELLL